MTKKNCQFCGAFNLFELHCRRLMKNCRAKKYLAIILSIWHINEILYRIMFNLFVLTVNLNLYCSSEALEVRANHLYCMCLTSVSYGHCGFRAK